MKYLDSVTVEFICWVRYKATSLNEMEEFHCETLPSQKVAKVFDSTRENFKKNVVSMLRIAVIEAAPSQVKLKSRSYPDNPHIMETVDEYIQSLADDIAALRCVSAIEICNEIDDWIESLHVSYRGAS